MRAAHSKIPSNPTSDHEDVIVSNNNVQASLQKMLDLTVRRLMFDPKIVSHIYEIQNKFGNVRLEFIYKLGNQ